MVRAGGSCDARGNDHPRGTTVTCTTCGAKLETTATTCPVCGASLPSPDPDPAARDDAPEPDGMTADRADAIEPDVAEPGTAEPGAAEPHASQPGAAEPSAPEPSAPEPGTPVSEAWETGAGEPAPEMADPGPGTSAAGGDWSPTPTPTASGGDWSRSATDVGGRGYPPPDTGGYPPPDAGGGWSPPPGTGGNWSPPPGSGGSWSAAPGGAQPVWGGAAAHPSGLSSDVRNWGLAAHLSAYVGAWVALAFLGPLVVWLLKRDDHPFIDHHAKEALNFNLSFLLYGVVGGIIAIPLGLITLGIGLIPIIIIGAVLVVAWLILPIIAAIKAANGEGYRYPFTIRFVS
jgi:uncharacterized protein